MRILSIDLETYSSVDIKKSGAYAYVRSPDFQILLNGFMLWGEMREPIVLDFSTEDVLPEWFVGLLTRPDIKKRAYNATFERLCFLPRSASSFPLISGKIRCSRLCTAAIPHPLKPQAKL